MQIQGVWVKVEMTMCFFRQSWRKDCRQIREIIESQQIFHTIQSAIFVKLLQTRI